MSDQPDVNSGIPTASINDYSIDTSPRKLIVGFATIILAGTVLLRLPFATASSQSLTWAEALFTATSATTVTGLVVVPTAETLSVFGELVVLALIQVGGLGFIIFSVVLLRLIGRHMALGERRILRQVMGVKTSHGVVDLALSVLVVTLGIELLGAAILFGSWWPDMGPGKAAYYAIFHSISAFCNAGFDLFGGMEDPLLLGSRQSFVVTMVLAALITIGTMGITAIFDVINFPRRRHFTLHTKLILPVILAMTVVGTTILLAEETLLSSVLSSMTLSERWLTAFFTVVSSRTAGITFLPIQELGAASQLTLMLFMFIGGAPASMGGGIGLTTIAVLLATLHNNVRGFPDVRVFHRTIPIETVFKAAAILLVSTILVVTVTTLILLFDGGELVPVMFEVISAFSNTGYSMGITSDLSQFSRLMIVFTMFWGRLGPLTLVVAIAQRSRRTQIIYPEEHIIIG